MPLACRRIFLDEFFRRPLLVGDGFDHTEGTMSETILVGRGREIELMPRSEWEGQLSKVPEAMKTRLGFMTEQHHLVRYFVVRELPRVRWPITPEYIASSLVLPLARIDKILGELEERLFFLVRDSSGQVSWAFPVTAEVTPHRLTFSTGDRINGA